MGEDTEQINLVVPKTMKKWLDEHKEINRSKLFRNAVYRKMYPKKERVSSLVFFIAIMGVVFSITLIGIGLTPSPMYTTIRSVLPILGGVLGVTTSLLYYREKKRIMEENISNA